MRRLVESPGLMPCIPSIWIICALLHWRKAARPWGTPSLLWHANHAIEARFKKKEEDLQESPAPSTTPSKTASRARPAPNPVTCYLCYECANLHHRSLYALLSYSTPPQPSPAIANRRQTPTLLLPYRLHSCLHTRRFQSLPSNTRQTSVNRHRIAFTRRIFNRPLLSLPPLLLVHLNLHHLHGYRFDGL